MSKKPNPPNNESYDNISGANVNIKGTQHGNITINHGANQTKQDPDVQQVLELIQRLIQALDQVDVSQREDADAVATFARQIAAEIVKQDSNKKTLRITGESLKAAAVNLLSVAPIAAEIARTLFHLK